MTEKIIIDGVNVSECKFLRRCIIPDNEGCKIDDSLCCDVGNCHFKQRKRLEQENADLKKQIESQKGLINVGGKAQNEYLKEIAELRVKIIKLTEENGNLIINRNTVENNLRDTERRLILLQKANIHNLVLLQRRNNALEEIREDLETQVYCECSECGNDDYSECIKCMTKRYMEKINEVLNEQL